MQDPTQVTKAGIIPATQPQSNLHGMNSTMEVMDVLYVNSSTGQTLTRTDTNISTLEDTSPPSDIAMIVLLSTAICFACVVIIGCYWNPRKKRKDPDLPGLTNHSSHHSHHSHHFNSPPIMIDESHIKMDELKLRVYRHSMYFVVSMIYFDVLFRSEIHCHLLWNRIVDIRFPSFLPYTFCWSEIRCVSPSNSLSYSDSNHSHRSSRQSFSQRGSQHKNMENGVFDLSPDIHGPDASARSARYVHDVNLSETIETAESFSDIEVGVMISKRDTRTDTTMHGYGGIETFDTDDLEQEMESDEESVSDQLLMTATNLQTFLHVPVPGNRSLQMDDINSTHL